MPPAMLMAVRSMKAHFNASTVAQKGHAVPDRWVEQTSLRFCGGAAISQGYAYNAGLAYLLNRAAGEAHLHP